MNLDALVAMLGNRTDYAPGTDNYFEQVRDLINEAYLAFACGRAWTFAQREARVTAHADVTVTLSAVTSTKNIAAPASAFLAWMEGHIIEIDGEEYEITQVDSATSAWIDTAVSTSTGDTAIIKQRYVDLPEDCVDVLQVSQMARVSGESTEGRYAPLSRAEGEMNGYDLLRTGSPDRWIPADPAVVPAPVTAGTLSTTAGTAWTAGVYKFKVGYKYGERYSGPCHTELSHTAVSTSAVVPVITLPALDTGSGYKYVIYCKPPGYAAYRIYRDDIAETGGATTLNTSPGTAWAAPSRARMTEAGGVNQRIRLYPRQDADVELTIRYLRRAPQLLEKSDTPIIPAPHQRIAGHLALLPLLTKKTDNVARSLVESEVKSAILALERRYLTQGSRRWVRAGWGGWSDTMAQRRTLTHTG